MLYESPIAPKSCYRTLLLEATGWGTRRCIRKKSERKAVPLQIQNAKGLSLPLVLLLISHCVPHKAYSSAQHANMIMMPNETLRTAL